MRRTRRFHSAGEGRPRGDAGEPAAAETPRLVSLPECLNILQHKPALPVLEAILGAILITILATLARAPGRPVSLSALRRIFLSSLSRRATTAFRTKRPTKFVMSCS